MVTYAIPYSAGLRVKDGDRVSKGQELTDGALSPHEVLRIRGVDAVHNYLIQEVQKPYRQQGVDINDKHIEVIVRQMMRKTRVEDAGDSTLLSGSTVDVVEYKDAVKAVQDRIAAGEKREDGEELRLPTSTRLLLGITKASLATESFLSAASFQETTKVLTEAPPVRRTRCPPTRSPCWRRRTSRMRPTGWRRTRSSPSPWTGKRSKPLCRLRDEKSPA